MKGSQNQMEMKSDLQIEREIVKKGEARKMMQLKKKFILKYLRAFPIFKIIKYYYYNFLLN